MAISLSHIYTARWSCAVAQPSSRAMTDGAAATTNWATRRMLVLCHQGADDASAPQVPKHRCPASQRRVDELDLVGVKRPIGGDNRNSVEHRLADQHPIEWIAVVIIKAGHQQRMAVLHR